MSFVFNNNVSGSGANIAQGQTVSQTIQQTFGGDRVPTVPEVFQAIDDSLFGKPESSDPSSDTPCSDVPLADAAAGQPAVSDSLLQAAEETQEQILRPLQTMAELPSEELNTPDKMEQVQSLLNRLVPYAPQIGKGLAVFGSAALTSLASSNPVISGILAVCKLASDERRL